MLLSFAYMDDDVCAACHAQGAEYLHISQCRECGCWAVKDTAPDARDEFASEVDRFNRCKDCSLRCASCEEIVLAVCDLGLCIECDNTAESRDCDLTLACVLDQGSNRASRLLLDRSNSSTPTLLDQANTSYLPFQHFPCCASTQALVVRTVTTNGMGHSVALLWSCEGSHDQGYTWGAR